MIGLLLDLLLELTQRAGSALVAAIRRLPQGLRLSFLLLLLAITLSVFYPKPFVAAATVLRQTAMAALDTEAIPLRGQDTKAIDSLILRLGDFLYSGYSKQFERGPEAPRLFSAWEAAQVAAALGGLNLPGRQPIDSKKIVAFLQERRSEDCSCWKEDPSEGEGRAHVGATAWVVYAKAKLGVAAEPEEIRFLLSQQRNRYNSWPMFPCKGPDSGSTYATAWAVLALGEQVRRGLITDELGGEALDGLRSGLVWLETNRASGGLWVSYPKQNWADSTSFSNSGLATFVVLQFERQAPPDFGRTWLRQLPSRRPGASDSESFNSWICHEENMQREAVRYIVLPWVLAATRDAYPFGGLLGRRRAIALVQSLAEEQERIIGETKQEYFVAAELLMALRHLRENYLATVDGSETEVGAVSP